MKRSRFGGRIPLALSLVLLGLTTGRAQASAMRRHSVQWVMAQAVAASRHETYFREALANHWMKVQIPRAEMNLIQAHALNPESAFADYLRWRRSLNVARFDRFHPGLAAMLMTPEIIPPEIVHPHVIPPITHPQPHKIDGQVIKPYAHHPPDKPYAHHEPVPEPSIALMAFGMVGLVAWWRRRGTLGA